LALKKWSVRRKFFKKITYLLEKPPKKYFLGGQEIILVFKN